MTCISSPLQRTDQTIPCDLSDRNARRDSPHPIPGTVPPAAVLFSVAAFVQHQRASHTECRHALFTRRRRPVKRRPRTAADHPTVFSIRKQPAEVGRTRQLERDIAHCRCDGVRAHVNTVYEKALNVGIKTMRTVRGLIASHPSQISAHIAPGYRNVVGSENPQATLLRTILLSDSCSTSLKERTFQYLLIFPSSIRMHFIGQNRFRDFEVNDFTSEVKYGPSNLSFIAIASSRVKQHARFF